MDTSPHPEVYPHDTPIEILPDILFVHGSMRMGPGMWINRNMVAVRRAGAVTVFNAVRLNDEAEKILAAFGAVRHVVRLGGAHSRDDAYYVDRFDAQFWAQEAGEDAPPPRPDNVLREEGPFPFADGELFEFRESKRPEAIVWIPQNRGVLIACDALQHWESTSRCSLLGKAAVHLMGFRHPANVGPPWKRAMSPDGGSLKPDFDRLLERQFENLVGAHGQPLLGGAREALRKTVQRVF